MHNTKSASRTLAIVAAAMTMLPALASAEDGGGERKPLPREHYRVIAAGKCKDAVKDEPLPDTTSKVLRPLVVYLVADDKLYPHFAFICMQSNQTGRSKVSVSYTAFNRNGVMPVFYGDNSERCRPAQQEPNAPICADASFLTDGTSVVPAGAAVTVGPPYREYGATASVRTSFELKADNPSTPYIAYHHVKIETIGL